MLTNPQKSLIAMAKRQAGLNDEEYREALHAVTGCTSSTDSRLTDEHFDAAMKYLEAIYWLKVHKGELQRDCRAGAVFRQKGFWAAKNTRQETSRDRYNHDVLTQALDKLEAELLTLGYGPDYCSTIRQKVTKGRGDDWSLRAYKVALERTLRSKRHMVPVI
jgi:hypothetical protein